MKLLILGATGGIGREILQQGLDRGHTITAFVRAPVRIEDFRDRISVVTGDLLDADAMAKAFDGHDAILSAFGPITLRPSTLRRDFGRALAAAMRRSGVHRCEIVSAAFLFRDIGFFGNILKATVFRGMTPDMATMETAIQASDLEWTIVRPPRLTNGPVTKTYRVADGNLPSRGFFISRADVAHFMLGEAEEPVHLHQIVGLAD
jgi:putative NADH-flavin reductase